MFKFSLRCSKKPDQIKLDDLPKLVYESLFKNLSISDLFNCRLINKKFYKHVKKFNNVCRLIIGKKNIEDYLWLNNESFGDEYEISLKTYRRIKSISLFNLNESLRSLIINLNDDFEFEELFNLTNLNYLEIQNFKLNRDEYLNFENLKILIIKNNFNQFDLTRNILLNTPQLEKIKIDIWNINFVTIPDNLKHLIIEMYEIEKINMFKNLEIIEFNYLSEPLDISILDIFKYLKLIRININFDDQFLSDLIEIFRKKTKLERQIDIYLSGVKIVYEKQFNEFKFYKSALEYQIKNYFWLNSDLYFMNQLSYIDLENYFKDVKNDLPKSFFDRYSNLSNIVVNYEAQDNRKDNRKDNKNPDNLIWFLRNLKNLKILELSNIPLFNQRFCKLLPTKIIKLSIDYKENINYDFILNLTKLTKLIIYAEANNFNQTNNFNQKINHLAFRLFLNLKYLKTFRFQLDELKFFEIRKNDNGTFDLKNKLDINHVNHICEKELNFEKLINLLIKCNDYCIQIEYGNAKANRSKKDCLSFNKLKSVGFYIGQKIIHYDGYVKTPVGLFTLIEMILSLILSPYVTSFEDEAYFKSFCLLAFWISFFSLIFNIIAIDRIRLFTKHIQFWPVSICLLFLFIVDAFDLFFMNKYLFIFAVIFSLLFFLHVALTIPEKYLNKLARR